MIYKIHGKQLKKIIGKKKCYNETLSKYSIDDKIKNK